jgi:uncharacterized membrane protein YphA (DoxX/SURF4 family)
VEEIADENRANETVDSALGRSYNDIVLKVSRRRTRGSSNVIESRIVVLHIVELISKGNADDGGGLTPLFWVPDPGEEGQANKVNDVGHEEASHDEGPPSPDNVDRNLLYLVLIVMVLLIVMVIMVLLLVVFRQAAATIVVIIMLVIMVFFKNGKEGKGRRIKRGETNGEKNEPEKDKKRTRKEMRLQLTVVVIVLFVNVTVTSVRIPARTLLFNEALVDHVERLREEKQGRSRNDCASRESRETNIEMSRELRKETVTNSLGSRRGTTGKVLSHWNDDDDTRERAQVDEDS